MSPVAKHAFDATGVELRKISCVECHRLKLKCNKKVPCSTCIRRGCVATCPIGINSESSPATRAILALRAAAGSSGLAHHPLLTPELLAIKQGVNVPRPVEEEEEGLAGAFGTLSVSEGSSMRFLGASATEQLLLMEYFDSHGPPRLDWYNLPPSLAQASLLWPFAPLHLPRETLSAQVTSQLPPLERATALYEAYLTNLSWSVAPIDRQQIVSEIMPLFYRRNHHPTDRLHELTLLLVVFACGAAADLTQPPCNSEAKRYSQLARAALSLHGLFHTGGSLVGTQAIILLGSYEVFAAPGEDIGKAQEAAWKIVSLGLTLASSVSVDRDPARWNLDSNMVQRRRSIFWEVYLLDHWKSLDSGRPPVFPASVVDCEFPIDDRAIIDEDRTIIQSVRYWRYRFGRDVLPRLTEKLCTARPLRYTEILELDRHVRDFDTVPLTQPSAPDTPKPNFIPEFHSLHPLITVWYKEMALLHVHRGYFARAMLESPRDPMRSSFAVSFLATYRSATCILEIVRNHYDRLQLVFLRVIRRSALRLSAFVELELAITLFEQTSAHPVAKRCLPLLRRIRDKASNVLYKSRVPKSPQSGGEDGAKTETENGGVKLGASADHVQVSWNGLGVPVIREDADSHDDVDAELFILRGTARVVDQRSSSVQTYMSSSFASTSARSSANSLESSSPMSRSGSTSMAFPEPSSGNIGGMSSDRGWPDKRLGTRTGLIGDVDTACFLSPSFFVEVPAATETSRQASRGFTENEGVALAHKEAQARTYAHTSNACFPDTEMGMTQIWWAEQEQERVNAAQFASDSRFQQQQQRPQQWPSTTWMMQNPTSHSPFGDPSFASASDSNTGLDVGSDHIYFAPQMSAFTDSALDAFMAAPNASAPVIHDDAAHYQSEGEIPDAASAEAWRMFVQQSGFVIPDSDINPDMSLSGWEGLTFS
ncbi:hypothetical protein DFH11DRAFT_1616261 [Phellopilus nigrolimitatus]|nr:hypothetical protein DFH11DRAFT_1616261 [Phellopilus nigrolimitatus]